MKRPRLAPSAQEHPAVVRYLKTGRYPVKGQSAAFSWDVWTHPHRIRTPEAEAERVVAFVNSLTHAKGPAAGQPFALRPWQRDILEPIVGTLDPEGYRVIRTVLCELPTRNGKTELAAALALYLLCGDQEQGGEVYSVAVDTDQASLVFNVASTMVRRDPELAARLEVVPSRRRIIHHASGSVYKVLASDAPSALGVNASGVVMDELAAWPQRDMYDVMASRTGSRRAPLSIIITTAGSDQHSVGFEVHEYACKVRDGRVRDDSFLPVIFAAPDDADVFDEGTWFAANPALDDFRSLEEFRVAARHAKEVPGREASFRQLYLNQWNTNADVKWLDLARWDACKQESSDDSLAGRRCYAGLDLSMTTDLSALVLLFPEDTGGYTVKAEFWCPQDYIALRGRRDRAPYPLWVQQGFLIATPGNVVDYGLIAKRIHEVVATHDVREIGVDPWNAKGFIAQLQTDGVPALEVGQTMANLTSATKELEKLVLSGQLHHDGHPILRWCASNTVVVTDHNGNIRPSKERSPEKIDGVAALVNALARAILAPAAASVYNHRPLSVIEHGPRRW